MTHPLVDMIAAYQRVLDKLPEEELGALKALSDEELGGRLDGCQPPQVPKLEWLAEWHLRGARDRNIAGQAEAHRAKIAALVTAGKSGKAVDEALIDLWALFDSSDRLPGVLPTLAGLPDRLFWRSFAGLWSMCDDTWEHLDQLLPLLRRHRDHAPARRLGNQATEIRVWRGCTCSRILGISWTRHLTIAAGFAEGHRGVPVPDPVVVSAFIPRSGVFLYNRSRGEGEVVLDPAELIDIEVLPI
jgi:hypothetical protein